MIAAQRPPEDLNEDQTGSSRSSCKVPKYLLSPTANLFASVKTARGCLQVDSPRLAEPDFLQRSFIWAGDMSHKIRSRARDLAGFS